MISGTLQFLHPIFEIDEWLFWMIKEEKKTRCTNENASQLKSLTEKVFALGLWFIIKSFIDLHVSKVNTSWGK